MSNFIAWPHAYSPPLKNSTLQFTKLVFICFWLKQMLSKCCFFGDFVQLRSWCPTERLMQRNGFHMGLIEINHRNVSHRILRDYGGASGASRRITLLLCELQKGCWPACNQSGQYLAQGHSKNRRE